MTTILVTGARGFVGRNLVARLQTLPDTADIQVLQIDVEDSAADLMDALAQADFVYHLAGVNRPQNEADFQTGSADLTAAIIERLQARGSATPILIISLAQAALDNPYERSKKAAEDHLFAYGAAAGAAVYVYRLPNLFGKWSRPHYNSVVATFCYNVAHGLPIQINNPDHALTLVYIDDVVDEFLLALKGEAQRGADGFCTVPRSFSVTVGALAARINAIADSRKSAILPDMGDLLTKFLYATYLSYLETDNFAYAADMKTDQRGWLAELIKSPHMGQIFVSTTKPGITRGGHYHHSKAEKFVVVQGQAVIRFRKIDGAEIIEYPVSGAKIEIVDIPPGYTHDITNVGGGDVITLFWACEIFEPQRPDTYFLKV